MGRGGHAQIQAVEGGKGPAEGIGPAFAQPDLHQGAGDDAHHVIEKGIPGDAENRFIPTLLEETDKIKKAQMARGADFESGNLLTRAKAMVPLLVPLFVSAFRRAGDLAMAMESRCYHGGEGRTRLRVLRFTRADAVAAGIVALLLVLILLERTFLGGILA